MNSAQKDELKIQMLMKNKGNMKDLEHIKLEEKIVNLYTQINECLKVVLKNMQQNENVLGAYNLGIFSMALEVFMKDVDIKCTCDQNE